MRNYNAVSNTLEITTSPGEYIAIDKYKEGGQKMSSLLYLPKRTFAKEEEQSRYYTNISCLGLNNYNVIAVSNPKETNLLEADVICLFGSKFTVNDFNECDKSKLYWVHTSQSSLEVLTKIEPMKIDTLYVKYHRSTDGETFKSKLFQLAKLTRLHNIKHIFMEIVPSDVLHGYVVELELPFTATLTIVITCNSEDSVAAYIGARSGFTENAEKTARFVLPNLQLLGSCNQYFYQDNAFTRFSTISCTNNDIAYNVIYYYNHKKSNDIRKHVDILNIMDYQKCLRSR